MESMSWMLEFTKEVSQYFGCFLIAPNGFISNSRFGFFLSC
jgi:hypothetical protein